MNEAIELGDLDNEALKWLLRSDQKTMPRRHRRSTEHFHLCWRATRAKLVVLVNKYQRKSLDLYPRQQFVREQAQLLVADYVEKMDSRQFTAARFREGVENLYYLLEMIQTKDPLARNTLSVALCEIVLACGDLVEYYEVSESLSVTDWKLVSVLFKERVTAHTYRMRRAKLQDFKLGNMIGVGGFGVVYRAKLGRIPCVLKFVPPSVLPSSEQALVDKEVACMINHPCLVTCYASFMNQDAFINCMEFIEGVSLIRVIHKSPKGLPSKLVRVIIGQVGLAVQHLHFKGFIHRDVKPDNIMIGPGCRIKLLDFDTCKVSVGKYCTTGMPSFREKTGREFPGAELAGTVPYMAPEALLKTGLGRAVDWWAVGATTYHLSTGRLPFRGYSVEEVQHQAVVPSYTWPGTKNWSTSLLQFVADCMNPDPLTRLCSGHYSSFQAHQYFRGMDFQWLETEPILGTYSLINALMKQDPAYDPKHLSAGAHARRARLFPTMNFLESSYPRNCYYYSSHGFVNCLRHIERGYTPTLKDIVGTQESLEVYDDDTAPYVFQNFLESPEDLQEPPGDLREFQDPYEEPQNPYEHHRTVAKRNLNVTYHNVEAGRVHKQAPQFYRCHK